MKGRKALQCIQKNCVLGAPWCMDAFFCHLHAALLLDAPLAPEPPSPPSPGSLPQSSVMAHIPIWGHARVFHPLLLNVSL